jgi:hypothetical protein
MQTGVAKRCGQWDIQVSVIHQQPPRAKPKIATPIVPSSGARHKQSRHTSLGALHHAVDVHCRSILLRRSAATRVLKAGAPLGAGGFFTADPRPIMTYVSRLCDDY